MPQQKLAPREEPTQTCADETFARRSGLCIVSEAAEPATRYCPLPHTLLAACARNRHRIRQRPHLFVACGKVPPVDRTLSSVGA